MSRPWRIQYEGAIYHIMSRGVGRGKIFLNSNDYIRFLSYLEKAVEKFNIEIFAFVLMTNHYHLLLRTTEPNISKVMQWIQTSYSIYYNLKHRRSGHLFQGRFKGITVEDESYWIDLSLYIHLNPVRAGIVEDVSKYKWSSYHDYISLKNETTWLDSDAVLKEYGENRRESKKEYRKLIRGISGKEKAFLEDIKYGVILGSDEFLAWAQKKFIDHTVKIDSELPQKKQVSNNGILSKVIEEIVKNYKIEKETLLKRKRRIPVEARDAGMYILKVRTGLKNKEIGNVFGVSESAVNKAALRIDDQIRTQKYLKIKIDQIVNSVFKV
ncbi:MAG: transposase [Candidatus Anammoxibacter sp.]